MDYYPGFSGGMRPVDCLLPRMVLADIAFPADVFCEGDRDDVIAVSYQPSAISFDFYLPSATAFNDLQ